MTKALIRLFVKNHENTRDPAVRGAYGRMAGVVGIFCNLLLFAGKFIAGTVFGSIAIAADAINNLSDASSNIVSLIGFKLAEKPADEDHPYGHARFEYLAGLAVAVMVLVIGVELAKNSLDKILHPTPVVFSWLSVAVLAASILVKLWMALFNTHIGKLIDSSTLQATAADSRNDVLSTGAVLLATLISRFTPLELDGWDGPCGGGVHSVQRRGPDQGDAGSPAGPGPGRGAGALHPRQGDELPRRSGHPRPDGARLRPRPPLASVHVEMAAEADVMESHDVIDNIERDFWDNDHLHVVIHFDPIITKRRKGERRPPLAGRGGEGDRPGALHPRSAHGGGPHPHQPDLRLRDPRGL